MTNVTNPKKVERRVVLCVEDDDALRSLLGTTLRNTGFTVTEAATCAEAKRAVQKGMPVLAILDVDLPDGDGFNLAIQLRQTGQDSLPILIISGQEFLTCKQKAQQLSVKFLPKPFGPLTLLTAVNSLAGVSSFDE